MASLIIKALKVYTKNISLKHACQRQTLNSKYQRALCALGVGSGVKHINCFSVSSQLSSDVIMCAAEVSEVNC